MRAASEATIKADIEQEDRAVCAKFGFASGSGFFACSDALARVYNSRKSAWRATPFGEFFRLSS